MTSLRTLTVALLLATPFFTHAQTGGVGIGTSTPDASAALDVRSSTGGVLVPRLTQAQRLAIAGPATGLLVYQTDQAPQAGFWFNAGTPAAPGWTFISPSGDNLGNHTATQDLDLANNKLLSASRIGVGTSTPALGLDVAGPGSIVGLRNAATWDHLYLNHDGSTAFISAGGANTGLSLRVGNGSSGGYGGQSYTDVMRLLPSGRVGLGTSTPFSQLANTATNIVGSDNTGGNPGSLTWAASQQGYAGLLYNAQAGAGANGLAVKVAGTDPAATALDVSTGSSQAGQGAPLFVVRANGATGLGLTPINGYRLAVGAAANQSGLYLALNGASTNESLRLEHNGSNLIVRPTAAGGTSTVVENTGGGGLLINPSGGNVGIGTSSPPRARLDVNGSVLMSSYSLGFSAYGLTERDYTWTHNLGYKPILMLSIDGTGGNQSNYITPSYEDIDNNTTIIKVFNSFSNTFTLANFRVRWIIVGQQ